MLSSNVNACRGGALCKPAFAVDKYVDCTNGNDANDGSFAHRWKTIAKAAGSAQGGDIVHVTAGPCSVSNVSFSSNLTGPGPNCRSGDAQCTIFRGEPGAVSVTTMTNGNGFLITGGVAHLKIENFTFVISGGSQPFNEPVKILGGQPSDIYLKNISVEGAHDSGIKVFNCHDILIEAGRVQGTTGDGYQIRGMLTEPTSNVVFRGAEALQNGKEGFVVPSRNSEVSTLTFDRTVAMGNGTITAEDGYDIQGSNAVPSPTPIARFLDAEATLNSKAGFRVWSSAQFENIYAANNTKAGIAIRLRSGLTRSVVSVLNSTVKDNGSPQLEVAPPGVDLELHNTLFTGNQTEILKYNKGYTGSQTGGGRIRWTRDLVSRTSANGTIVEYHDRSGQMGQKGQKRVCTIAQNKLATCDAVGDCNFDLAVTIDELVTMTNITQGSLPLSSCFQGDRNGDGQITIDEIVTAVNISLTDDAHDETVTGPPSFQTDSRHLLGVSPGSNAALIPSSFGVAVCRADCCDADSHARPEGVAYDIGAFEGEGMQSKSNACVNVGPGQCCVTGGTQAASPAAPVALALGAAARCSARAVQVPVVMTGGAGRVAGLQLDLLYDATVFGIPNPGRACTLNIAGYGGAVYTALQNQPAAARDRGRLRIVVANLRGNGDILEDGTLMTCTFKVLADPSDSEPFSASHLLVSSGAGDLLDSALTPGEVDVAAPCWVRAGRGR